VRPDPKEKVGQSQAQQEKNYNHGVKLRQPRQQQAVWVKTYSKNDEIWSRGTVIQTLGPVTYLVDVNGQQMKRHIDQIREHHQATSIHVPVDSHDPVPIITTPFIPVGNAASAQRSSARNPVVTISPPGSTQQHAPSPPRQDPVQVAPRSPVSSRPKRVTRPIERLGY